MVTKVAPARSVSTGIVQDVTLDDNTATMELALWNKNVDQLHESTSYDFKKLKVNTYRDIKVLNFTNDSSFLKLEKNFVNIPATVSNSKADQNGIHTIEAYLIGIQKFRIHVWCLQCNSSLPIDDESLTVECPECHLLQLVNYCTYQITSKIKIKPVAAEDTSDSTTHLLDTSTEIFQKLFQLVTGHTTIQQDSDKNLLIATINQIFTVTHNGSCVTDICPGPQPRPKPQNES